MFVSPLKPFNVTKDCAPDKSITHRAIMFNAASRGSATVYNPLLGGDCLSTAECMRNLGAEVTVLDNKIKVKGTQKFSDALLDAGNSGTTARLLAGLVSGRNCSATIIGDSSLSSRPMNRVVEPLRSMGANIASSGGKLPIEIKPSALSGITYDMPHSSAQVKSAIILAALNADGVTTINERVKSRNHTEIMLKNMGANIVEKGNTVTVSASEIQATDIFVPGDISSAAYLLGLAAVVKGSRVCVKNVGLNATRTGIIEVLRQMGADMEIVQNDGVEPYGDIILAQKQLKPFTITSDIVPALIDEIPLLAAIACFADGKSEICGASELKVKESDRIKTTVAALTAYGARITPTDDGMIIYGEGGLTGGGSADSFGDHRIAMMAAVAAAGSEKGGDVLGEECSFISYPGFFDMLRRGLQ